MAGVLDPTKVVYILEMLKGYGKLGSRLDTRLPITLPILKHMMIVTPSVTSSTYQAIMFKAMCSMAFFAFLRIGEITTTRQAHEVLQLSQVTKQNNEAGATVSMRVTFHQFKHHYNQHPMVILLTRHPNVCPVQSLLDYIHLRGTVEGPLFQTLEGKPVSRTAFTDQLSLTFKTCGLDPTRYKGHSFRIGAASYAASCGFSDTQIRLLGRWKSDAFKKYIRIPSLTH